MRVTLDTSRVQRHFHGLDAGSYVIEYNDNTHLEPTQWVQLLELQVKQPTLLVSDEGTEQYYSLRKSIANLPVGSGKDAEADNERRTRILEDSLSLALGRAGLLSPHLPEELLEDILRLEKEEGVVIVPDTNALHNGALHWLLRVLRRPSVWLLPLAASLTTVQQRDATVKGLVNKKKLTNLGQALRSRGLVNGTLGLLQRHRGRSQVVELEHSLLRYQKTSSSTGSDPDNSDVLEDRLIIEAIHGVLRTMRSRTARRVVTSDVNLARVLEAEGISTLFVPAIWMGDEFVDCVSFDALANGFVGAPLSLVMWELGHAFGSVRLKTSDKIIGSLDCYWPGKSPAEWSSETLTCHFPEPLDEADSPNDAPPLVAAPPGAVASYGTAGHADTGQTEGTEPSVTSESQAAGEVENSALRQERAERREDVPLQESPASATKEQSGEDGAAATTNVDKRPPRTKAEKGSTSITKKIGKNPASQMFSPLPRASLPTAMRLLGVLARFGPGTAAQAAAELGGSHTADVARRAFDLLMRIGLVENHSDVYGPGRDVLLVDNALRQGDLDALNDVFVRFEPYRALQEELKDRTTINRDEIANVISGRLGKVGSVEASRLPRYHILLGQAWTDGDLIRDGSRRLTDRDMGDAFDLAFRQTAADGLARVVDLLEALCKNENISPWAAKAQIERLMSDRLLTDYSFEPSAGGKPKSRDEVLSGSLDGVETSPVILDRFHLGQRPVFTVGRASR